MATARPQTRPTSARFLTDSVRWRALLARDPSADGQFVYAVRTTGVYCRPTCAARRPLRKNVSFFATPSAAQTAGYRPCRRCRPQDPSSSPQADHVVRACRLIDAADRPLALAELAAAVGVSPFHLHRTFKRHTGVTPKAYAAALRSTRLRESLAAQPTVTAALFGAGFQTTGRFYAAAGETLGMTPSAFRAGGAGMVIAYCLGQTSLGTLLVAATPQGVCAILLGGNLQSLLGDLTKRFPRAKIVSGKRDFQFLVERAISLVETPSAGCSLPLDIRGTAFQRRVWEMLRQIPAGQTQSYTEIAARLGAPRSVRAVAQACAANPLAIAIPCHRAVRKDGALAGYRWGLSRKAELLRRERS